MHLDEANLLIVIAGFLVLPASLFARWHPRAATVTILAGAACALAGILGAPS